MAHEDVPVQISGTCSLLLTVEPSLNHTDSGGSPQLRSIQQNSVRTRMSRDGFGRLLRAVCLLVSDCKSSERCVGE